MYPSTSTGPGSGQGPCPERGPGHEWAPHSGPVNHNLYQDHDLTRFSFSFQCGSPPPIPVPSQCEGAAARRTLRGEPLRGGSGGGGEGGSPPEKLNIKSPPDGIPGFDSEMLYQWMLDVYSCWLARSCCPMARIDNAQQERSSRPARLAGQPRPRCLGVWLVESESQVRFCQLANSKRRKSAP